jgi:hypothetical protein
MNYLRRIQVACSLIACFSLNASQQHSNSAPAPRPIHPAANELAGVYTGKFDQLEKLTGPIDLYDDLALLPSRRYYLLTHTDITPVHVLDSGNWRYSEGRVYVLSDHRAVLGSDFKRERFYSVYTMNRGPRALVCLLQGSVGSFKNNRIEPDKLAADRTAFLGGSLIKTTGNLPYGNNPARYLEHLLAVSNDFATAGGSR